MIDSWGTVHSGYPATTHHGFIQLELHVYRSFKFNVNLMIIFFIICSKNSVFGLQGRHLTVFMHYCGYPYIMGV